MIVVVGQLFHIDAGVRLVRNNNNSYIEHDFDEHGTTPLNTSRLARCAKSH